MGAPPQSTRLSVLIPFLLITLVWGSTWLVIKDQLATVPPSWSVAYRFAIGGAAMLVWAALRKDRLWLGAFVVDDPDTARPIRERKD